MSVDVQLAEILQLDLQQAYSLLRSLAESKENDESQEAGEAVKKARFGINLKFDLYDILEGKYTEKTRAGLVIVHQGKLVIPLNSFRNEMEQREAIIRGTLIHCLCNLDPFVPRNDFSTPRNRL